MTFLEYILENEVAVQEQIEAVATELVEADGIELYDNDDGSAHMIVVNYVIEDIETFAEGYYKGLAHQVLSTHIVDEFTVTNPESLELTLEYILELY